MAFSNFSAVNVAGELAATGGLALGGDVSADNVDVTTAFKVGGTQVVNAQLANIAFVNADLANTVTRVNAIITALETHGLIAAL